MAHALAQRELEGRHRGELAAETEQLDRLIPRAIRDLVALPEAVGERHDYGGCGRDNCRVHGGGWNA